MQSPPSPGVEWRSEIVEGDPVARSAERAESLDLRLAGALGDARKAAGLTQAQVSEASGLKQSVVSRLENPGHNPTLDSVVRYLDAVGADLVLSVVVGENAYAATEYTKRSVVFSKEIVASTEAGGISLKE